MNRWWKVSPLLAVALSAATACNTKGHDNEDTSFTPIAPTPGPQPQFTQTVTAATPPPPISGGTLAVAKDGRTIVASDPDRDLIYLVDIPSRTITHTLSLAPNSEPGRVAIDTKGRAHIALRKSGNLATIELATGAITERHVCVAPRGLAYDADSDYVHVACAEGELVSIPLGAGEVKRVGLDRDLRDVIVTKDKILVSRFRQADIVELTRAGELKGKANTRGGNLGWRIAAPPIADDGSPGEGEPAMVSQEPTNPVGPSGLGYYGSGATDACAAPTITTTRLDIPGQGKIYIPPAVLPVDLATNGHEYTIVAAGNGHTSDLPQVFTHRVKTNATSYSSSSSSSSSSGFSPTGGTNYDCTQMAKGFIPGQAIAAAYDGEDQLIVQSREPAALFIMSPDRQRVWKEIKLSDVSREDTGHAIFHSNSGGFLACASCHAEGAEDGRTWHFVEGDRRTPSMRGTLNNTAPFHWDGEMKDLRQLVDHVFVTRMSGPKVEDKQVDSLKSWLFSIPPPPKVEQPAVQVDRGAKLYVQRGCNGCHTGAELTNNETRDVGTGGLFQVPSLIGIGWRAPYLHNGCAKTLRDRFNPACGGDKHGDTADLTADQIDDLTKYLETL